jgi:transposase/DNA replication protein DnaC
MRHVREVLRLKFVGGVPTREIARRIGVAPSTVRATIKRFQAVGLSWPLPEEPTDAALEAALFPDAGTKQGHRRQVEPDWASIHRELKRKHVTLSILWDEYIARNPEGYRYSRFCELYRIWEAKLSVTMRQTHVGGDKLFVDYAGDTVPVIVDRLTGEVRQAQIFVAVMGASSFTYVEATWTQTLGDWIGAHTRALATIGGVPRLIVPDNAKVAVIKACLYEPQVNRTYAEMAAHYGSAVLPTRPRRPRDKAKVEACVLIVERWLIGRLRDRRFYSLAELNAAIGELLRRLNEERPIRRLGVTRRQLLEELDRPALKPLPTEPYVFAEWRVRRVGIDYHVEVEGHFYSVPYRFARSEVEVRLTGRSVEIFVKGERIAVHMRSSGNGKHTTAADHMPSSHRRYADWTIGRIRRAAALIGPATAALCDLILEQRPHPRAGLPILPRHPAVGSAVRHRTSGSRRNTRHRDRRAHLWLGSLHPRSQDRSARRKPAGCGRCADHPFQHPRLALLPIGGQALLTHPTLDLLHQLGLAGMAKAFSEIEASGEAATLTHPEWLALLLDQEASYRRDRRLHARLRYARLRHQAAVEDVDYRAARSLDRALFQKLTEGSWIDAHENLILCGPTGVGKSWLASALGHKACRDNRSVLYQRIPKLFADLSLARGDGRYARIQRSLGGVHLLILDDWGLEPLDAAARHDLLEILEERYGRRSTIITSQIPIDKWHELIGDPTYADAILDRIVHNAHRINLTGHSLRRSRATKLSKD